MDKRTIKSRQGLIVKYISLKALLWALLSYLSNHFLHPVSPTGLLKRPDQPQELARLPASPTALPRGWSLLIHLQAAEQMTSRGSRGALPQSCCCLPQLLLLVQKCISWQHGVSRGHVWTGCQCPQSNKQREMKEAWKRSLKCLQWPGRRQLLAGRQTQKEEFLRSGHSQETKDHDYPPLVSTHEATSGILCPVLPRQNKNIIDKLQLSQQKAMRVISAGALVLGRGVRGGWGLLKEWGLFSLEKTQLQGDLTAASQLLLQGVTEKKELGFFQGCYGLERNRHF